jgi:hypothetical protein
MRVFVCLVDAIYYLTLFFFFLIGVAIFGSMVIQPANANLWSAWKNGNLAARDTLSAYRVETPGFDVRTYEWIPVNAPRSVCLMSFSESGPVGLQCMDRGEPEQ